MRRNSPVATSADAHRLLPDPTVRRGWTAVATNHVPTVVNVWIWVPVLFAAVALVSAALAVRQTSTTVPAIPVKMLEPAKMALTTTPALARWVSLVKTAACEQMLVLRTHASTEERVSLTSPGQCVSVCPASWVPPASFQCRPVWRRWHQELGRLRPRLWRCHVC